MPENWLDLIPFRPTGSVRLSSRQMRMLMFTHIQELSWITCRLGCRVNEGVARRM